MQQINYLCHVQMKMEVRGECALEKDVLLYNFLPSCFQGMQEHDLKIKASECRAGEKDSSIYPGYTYVVPMNTEISQIGKRGREWSVLKRATSSPTSDALIVISLLTVAHLISSHLSRWKSFLHFPGVSWACWAARGHANKGTWRVHCAHSGAMW